jgi:transposase
MRPKGSADMIADRRRRALALLDDGLSLNAVARRLKCAPSSVMRWRDRRKKDKERVFEVGTSPGRPPRLSERQKKALARLLLKGAMTCGYRTDLWTTARVAEVVEREFGVKYDRDHMGRILHAIGFSCQKPDRRALERDEARIERWKQEEWPRIKKTPKTWERTSSSSTSPASS